MTELDELNQELLRCIAAQNHAHQGWRTAQASMDDWYVVYRAACIKSSEAMRAMSCAVQDEYEKSKA